MFGKEIRRDRKRHKVQRKKTKCSRTKKNRGKGLTGIHKKDLRIQSFGNGVDNIRDFNDDSLHAESDYVDEIEESECESETMQRLVPRYSQGVISPDHSKRKKTLSEMERMTNQSNEELESNIFGSDDTSAHKRNQVQKKKGSKGKEKNNTGETRKQKATRRNTVALKNTTDRVREDELWSEDELRKFLITLREQPVKEMNDVCNKWIMFAKRLEAKGVQKTYEQCRKQVIR